MISARLSTSILSSQACLTPTRQQPHRLTLGDRGRGDSDDKSSSSSSSNAKMDNKMDSSFEATPKAYKWRQPPDEGDARSTSSLSQTSLSPTDVRLLFPLAPRPHPHVDGSVASASLSAQSSSSPSASFSASASGITPLSLNSSFATAPQHEDDLSSIDSRSPLQLQQQQLQHPQTLTYQTALPPLDSSDDNDTDKDNDDDSHFNILSGNSQFQNRFGKTKKKKQHQPPRTSTTTTLDTSNSYNVTRQPPPAPTPQQEEQHPSKSIEKEMDEHPSKRFEQPKNTQQPPSSSVLKDWDSNASINSSSTTTTTTSIVEPAAAFARSKSLEESIEQANVFPTDSMGSKGGGDGSSNTTALHKNLLDRHQSSPSISSREASVSSLQQELVTADLSFVTAPLLLLGEVTTDMEDDDNDDCLDTTFVTAPLLLLGDVTADIEDDDEHDGILDTKVLYEVSPTKSLPRVSGRVLSGSWKGSVPCSPNLVFSDDAKDDYLNLSLDTVAASDDHENDDAESAVMMMQLLNTPSHNSPKRPDTMVTPRDISFESGSMSGDWKRDLQATRLEFDGDNNNNNRKADTITNPTDKGADVRQRQSLPPRHEDTTEEPQLKSQSSVGVLKARFADSDFDREILVEPRRSKPVVLKGDLKGHMQSADLLYRSKDDLSSSNMPREKAIGAGEIKVEPRKSKPVVLQGNLQAYMDNVNLLFQSKDDLAILPQQRQLSRMEIMVEPRAGSKCQVWTGNMKEIMPLSDADKEIDVKARRSKPVVLRGNMKDYFKNMDLIFQSKDDLNVLPRFQQNRSPSSMDITVEPLDFELRRVLSDDVTDIMPLKDEDNEIRVKPRRSKPVALRSDLKGCMKSADLIFRSNDDPTLLDKGKEVTEDSTAVENIDAIVFEPREAERVAVSGDLQDYVQSAAQVFHASIRDSTLVYHDTVEATDSQFDEEDDGAYNNDTSSIVSLQEELALASHSFDLEESVTSDEVTAPTKNLVCYPSSPEEAVIKRRAKVVLLPFPWCTPELLFVRHNELKPPLDALHFRLPPPPIEEEDELSELGDPATESTDVEPMPHPKPTGSQDDVELCAPTGDHETPATVPANDVAILYRGNELPAISRRKRSPRFLKALVRSFASRRSPKIDYFCVDCGSLTNKCGCEAALEDDLLVATRMESVYSIDVGKIVSDPKAKFVMVKAPDTAKKKRKGRRKRNSRKANVPATGHPDNESSNEKEMPAAGTAAPAAALSEVSDAQHFLEPEPPDSQVPLSSLDNNEHSNGTDEKEKTIKATNDTASAPTAASLEIVDMHSTFPEPPGGADDVETGKEKTMDSSDSTASVASTVSQEIIDKNATVPEPPGGAGDVEMEKTVVGASDGTSSMPTMSKDDKNAMVSERQSKSYVDCSASSAWSESIKILKIGKEAVPATGGIEDPLPKTKKKSKKLFRGIRKRVGSILKGMKGSRAKI